MRSPLRSTAVGVGLTLVAMAVAVAGGCGSTPPENLGVVHLELTAIPADVSCLRLTATGVRTVVQQFDVTPGSSASLVVTGLPTGTVVFTADAFAGSCATAGDRTTANWISEPQTLDVSTSEIVDLSLVMHRNGRVRVGVDFMDDVTATCTDGIQNGNETGVDCGGGTCAKCRTGTSCRTDADCEPGSSCAAFTCRTNPPTCTDGLQNGDETGVDCGGATCPKCGGTSCRTDADCDPGSSCAGFTCRPNLSCVLPDGAVAWWHADGDYLDSIGSHDGTPVGNVPFVPGFRGSAFAFDGVTLADVEASPSPDLDVTGGFTIDAWINVSAGVSGRIVDKIHAFDEDGYLLDMVVGHLRIQMDGVQLVTPDLLPTDAFIHVAGVFDAVRVALFVNGALVAEAPSRAAIVPTNDLPVRIGADSGGGSRFQGVIDEPRIFNRGLTDAEVHTLFLQGSGCP